MSEAVLVYKKDYLRQKPTIKDVEDFCFNARTRGAGDRTEVDVDANRLIPRSTLEVNIPEDMATGTFKEPEAAKSERVDPVAAAAFVLLPFLLALGFFFGGRLL